MKTDLMKLDYLEYKQINFQINYLKQFTLEYLNEKTD